MKRKVSQALTMEAAETAFTAFKERWGRKHPVVIRSWANNWLELTTYFKYPHEIRRMIDTLATERIPCLMKKFQLVASR